MSEFCLNCNKKLTQIAGKKKKKYCSNSCRQKHWQKEKKRNLIPFEVVSAKIIKLPDGKTEGQFILGVDTFNKFFKEPTAKLIFYEEGKEVNNEKWVAEYFPTRSEDVNIGDIQNLWGNNIIKENSTLGKSVSITISKENLVPKNKKVALENLISDVAPTGLRFKNKKKEIIKPPEGLTGIDLTIWKKENNK